VADMTALVSLAGHIHIQEVQVQESPGKVGEMCV